MRHKKLTRTTTAVITANLIFVAAAAFLRTRPNTAEAAANGQGDRLFREKGCIQCHYPDSTETKIGPGLKNILHGEQLPTSGRPATRENVRKQLIDPWQAMPSYEERLSKEELEHILDYLESL
ncbi:MAG: cytochrome c [Phycisphaerae bacterium]|nr:cytochrome c [Phycisphaerae bacterium]